MALLTRMVGAPLIIDIGAGAVAGLAPLLADRRISSGGHVAVVVGPGLGEELAAKVGPALANCEIVTVENGGVEAATYGRQGDPADAILDVAEEQGADLIVVGNKGMTGARRFLLGSVPNRVSHHAPCSVLIIRTAP